MHPRQKLVLSVLSLFLKRQQLKQCAAAFMTCASSWAPNSILAKVNIGSITEGNDAIQADTCVRNLGRWFDSTLSMSTHVNNVSQLYCQVNAVCS